MEGSGHGLYSPTKSVKNH